MGLFDVLAGGAQGFTAGMQTLHDRQIEAQQRAGQAYQAAMQMQDQQGATSALRQMGPEYANLDPSTYFARQQMMNKLAMQDRIEKQRADALNNTSSALEKHTIAPGAGSIFYNYLMGGQMPDGYDIGGAFTSPFQTVAAKSYRVGPDGVATYMPEQINPTDILKAQTDMGVAGVTADGRVRAADTSGRYGLAGHQVQAGATVQAAGIHANGMMGAAGVAANGAMQRLQAGGGTMVPSYSPDGKTATYVPRIQMGPNGRPIGATVGARPAANAGVLGAMGGSNAAPVIQGANPHLQGWIQNQLNPNAGAQTGATYPTPYYPQ